MSGTNRLMNEIFNDIKQKLNNNIQSKVYHDEVIKRPDSIVHRVTAPVGDDVPIRIREMKLLVNNPRAAHYSVEELFYQQGMMMADYEDDFTYFGEFIRYFPTYQQMNVHQLRGYFSWRTKVRTGEIVKTSTSFVYVYIYELINQIGIENAEDGFRKLKAFWEAYRELDSHIDTNVKRWLCDYVVYYNLDSSLLAGLEDTAFDESLAVLLDYPSQNSDDLFAAICLLSSYHMTGSKFYRDYPDDVKQAVCAVFISLAAFYQKHRKTGLLEKLFGTKTDCAYEMFHSAIFFRRIKYKNYEYVINDIHRYHCRSGKWSCEKYFGNRGKNKELGAILRTLDSRMREKYEYKAALKPEQLPKQVLAIIDKEIDQILAVRKKNTIPDIEIDLSKLAGIRHAADLTRDKLIVEESVQEVLDLASMLKPDSDEKYHKNVDTHKVLERIDLPVRNSTEKSADALSDSAGQTGNSTEKPADTLSCPSGQAENSTEKPADALSDSAGQAENSTEKPADTLSDSAGQTGNSTEKPADTLSCPSGQAENSTEKPADALSDSLGQAKSSTVHPAFSKNCPLDDTQFHFLRCLLCGEDYRKLLKERHIMVSVLVDAINETLYDQFMDTVIEFDGDLPNVVEDYVDELKYMIGL